MPSGRGVGEGWVGEGGVTGDPQLGPYLMTFKSPGKGFHKRRRHVVVDPCVTNDCNKRALVKNYTGNYMVKMPPGKKGDLYVNK